MQGPDRRFHRIFCLRGPISSYRTLPRDCDKLPFSDFNNRGDLRSRRRGLPPTYSSVDLHLTWDHDGSCWISFFGNWQQAMRRRKMLLEQRKQNVSILAYDTSTWPRGRVLDAHSLARRLEYRDDINTPPYYLDYVPDRRRQLAYLMANTFSITALTEMNIHLWQSSTAAALSLPCESWAQRWHYRLISSAIASKEILLQCCWMRFTPTPHSGQQQNS